MKHSKIAGLLGLLTVAALSARALMIALPPTPQRVATATAAYVGKVTAVADKAVKAAVYKDDEREMKIATVRVSETLLGKGMREVKVGFFVPSAVVPGRPIRPGLGRGTGPQLFKDQEGILMLHKHPTMKDVYLFADFQGLVAKKDNPGYDTELKGIKETAKLLADPMKGLKAKDAAERLKTAGLLVSRYRSASPGAEAKQEAVPADQSNLTPDTIAEPDWTRAAAASATPTPSRCSSSSA